MSFHPIRSLAIVAVAAAIAAAPARAEVVTFSTDGSFDAGASGGFLSADGRSLTFLGDGLAVILGFAGTPETTVAAPSATTLGEISLNVSGAPSTEFTVSGVGFTLDLEQQSPESAIASLSGEVSGTVGLDSSGFLTGFLTLSFANDTLTAGPIIYSLLGLGGGNMGVGTNSLVLVPGQGIPGVSSLNATIAVIPTPNSLVLSLMGAGVVGLVGSGAIRRRRT
jgi:hypothetical protein